MKYEKLSSGTNNKKGFLCGIIVGVVLIIIINFFMSYAKYKSVDSVKLASGTINYESADLNIIAVYKKDDKTTEYIETDDIPKDGYVIDNSMSYCTEPGKDDKIKNILNYANSKLMIDISKKGTKCYLYFEKPKTSKDTLTELFSNFKTAESGTNFSTGENGVLKVTGIDNGDNKNTLYIAEDNDGLSYFFRGQAYNNWVQFAGMRWRIIRINGDGTIRMIFQCSGADCTNTTGTKTNAETSAYKTSPYNDNTYVGYYYGNASASTYDETHKSLTTNPSTIAVKINTWYENNLKKYEDYIDPNAGFCNDRQKVTGVHNLFNNGTGYGTSTTSYAMWGRIQKNDNNRTEQLPTLKCGVNARTTDEQEKSVEVNNEAYQRDLFTKSGASKGNQILKYPIGLITADEVLLAGGYSGKTNSSYYLYTHEYYWTMSPRQFDSGQATMLRVDFDGYPTSGGVSGTYGVRPVINLKSNTKFKPDGNGTVDNPYVVVTE